MSSYCDPLVLPWTRALLREQLKCLINGGLRNDWKCVLKGIFEACIVYQVAFPESGPLHQSGLTSAIYYLHR